MKQKDWRDSHPIYEDERLEDIAKLVPFYRNLWVEADFHDDPPETVQAYKRLYEHYKQLLKDGKHYEPKF
jgi:hypothetical protein